MQPDIHLNYWAILAAVAASIALGFLWYGPIFGKAWIREMGMPADQKPDPKVMRRGLILMVVGSFLTAFVLAHTGEVWRPAVWNGRGRRSRAVSRLSTGFWGWVGFYAPFLLCRLCWGESVR